jgi:hypothetical protein
VCCQARQQTRAMRRWACCTSSGGGEESRWLRPDLKALQMRPWQVAREGAGRPESNRTTDRLATRNFASEEPARIEGAASVFCQAAPAGCSQCCRRRRNSTAGRLPADLRGDEREALKERVILRDLLSGEIRLDGAGGARRTGS